MIKRALDAGAHGIMVPMCHSEVCETATPHPAEHILLIHAL